MEEGLKILEPASEVCILRLLDSGMVAISFPPTFQKTLDAKPNDHSIVKPGELVDIVEMTPLTLSDRRMGDQARTVAGRQRHPGRRRWPDPV